MSIMRQMKEKAVAMMEAMAERARSPQDIEAARQRLVAEIQSGRVPAYVGVPLVQDLTQRLTQAKAQMAQQVAGMGVPQAPQGAPIAQQVMAQAQPAAGVEALPSNLPTSYAPGGLVAFEEGGQVERYQTGGSPAGRWWEGVKSSWNEGEEAAKLRNELQMKYGPASALPGLFMTQTDEQRQQAKQIAQLLPNLSLPQLKMLKEQGAAAIPDLMPPTAAAATPAAAPTAVNTPTAAPPNAPPAPPAAPAAPGVAMPKLNLPAVPALTDYSFLKKLPKDAQEASEKAVTAKKKELEDIDNPLFKAREERLSGREAAVDKDSAIGRALNLMSLGFGIAGSKERTLAGALGNEGRQGIADLIKGEAANRAAKERLEDLRDNLTQQRAAARKGNAAAAEAAGQRVSDDLYKAANLNATAMHYGNTEALQRYQTNQQGVLGLAQLQQQNAATNASLQLGREKLNILKEQVAAGNERAKAAMGQVEIKAKQAFQSSPEFRAAQEQAKKMSPIEAQRFMHQEWLKYSANAMPALFAAQGGGANIPSFTDLMKSME